MVLGVDYQPFGQGADLDKADPLSNATECLRDASLMQNLGVNTIRSYNLNPSLNHDECMSIFNSVGIYIILDVNSPAANQHLDRSDPASTYTKAYLTHVFTMIEAFKNYPNTLAFFSGNEIMNDVESSMANPPYVRALQREMKSYIKNHANRTIPVGYSAADGKPLPMQVQMNSLSNNIQSAPSSKTPGHTCSATTPTTAATTSPAPTSSA